jgi:hypothetical protein
MLAADAVIVAATVAVILVVVTSSSGWLSTSAATPAPHPRFESPGADTCRVSPTHCDRAKAMLDMFARVYQSATFPPGPGCADAVRRMQEHRAGALASLYELRMRLPNDVRMHDALTRHIQGVERATMVHVDDACDRCNLGRLHTRPIDDHYYAHWHRASNDQDV